MNQKTMKIAGYVVTGLFSAMMVFGGAMQLMTGEQVITVFQHLQIDNMMVMRFIGALKIAGAVGMWVPQGRTWAVHGFTLLFCGAVAAHAGVGDPMQEMMRPVMPLCMLIASEWLAKKSGQKMTSTAKTTKRKAA